MVVTRAPDWFVKIADFGISKRRLKDATTLHTLQQGTFGFAAPEVFGLLTTTEFDMFSVDMWSLGAVVYRMVTNTTTFQNIADMLRYSIGTSPFPKDVLNFCNVSQQAQDFILALMQPNPRDRLSANSGSEHPWITDNRGPLVENGVERCV